MFQTRYKNIMLSFFLMVSFCLQVSVAYAKIYRYVDADGRIHFTNVPTTSEYSFYRDEGERYQLATLINHYADQFQLDAALIKAVIKVESDFRADTVSAKGAEGLMQLMPETAKEMGVSDSFDPAQGIFGGSFYLRKMLDTFYSNLDYVLAAYNAGPNAVRRQGRIPPYNETQNYVKQVKQYLDYYRNTEDQM